MAGLMSLVTRVGLASEDRLGLTDSPSVPEPWQPSRAARRQGWYSRGAAAVRVERAAETAGCPSRDCWCPVCLCRAVTVSGEAWPLSWGQDGTSDS